jgi:sporulation protein YlmC with PRC-barrel domain
MYKTTANFVGQVLPAIALAALLALPASAEKAPDLSAAVIRTPPIEETVVVDDFDLRSLALASRLLHSSAYIDGGTKIGEVSDVVIGSDNRAAVIVDVGDFLGIPKRKVAIPVSKVTFEPKGGKIMIVAEVTKAELRNAKQMP